MLRKPVLFLFLLFFFSDLIVNAQSSKFIEILDIEDKKITRDVPLNPVIQLESEKLIKSINDIVKKLKPIPDNGYMIKIPLEPPVQVENEWVDSLIDELIVIIPKDEKAYLLLFDEENTTYFFTFNKSINKLLITLNLSI